jgi:hypothetical protein
MKRPQTDVLVLALLLPPPPPPPHLRSVSTGVDGTIVVCRDFLGLWCVSYHLFGGCGFLTFRSAPENCQPPSGASGYALVQKIRQVVQPFGSIRTFRAYLDHREHRNDQLRSELQLSGVSMLDAPHSGAKNVADQMMIGAWFPTCSTFFLSKTFSRPYGICAGQ